MVTGINTLICQVDDMDRAVGFYREVLGLSPNTVSPHWSDFTVGSLRLGLHPNFRKDAESRGGGWVVGLVTNDLKGLRDRLATSGFSTTHDYHEVPGGVVLDFSDPDGNALEAFQPGATMSDFP